MNSDVSITDADRREAEALRTNPREEQRAAVWLIEEQASSPALTGGERAEAARRAAALRKLLRLKD